MARWGVDLWDQRGQIEKRVDDGIAAVDRTRNLVAQLAVVESEYAKNLRKVIRSFAAGPDADSTQNQAWKTLLDGLEEVATQHDNTAANLNGDLSNNIRLLIKSKQKDREDIARAIAKLEADLGKAADEYDKAKKKYEKAEKEADVAKQAFLKSEESQNVTKKQVEKARQNWAQKAKLSEGIQQALAQQTNEFNQNRTLFFHTQMPSQFDAYQQLDESRAEALVQSFAHVGAIFRDGRDKSLAALRRVDQAVAAHNKVADSALFAKTYKTGQPLPRDLDVPAASASGPAERPVSMNAGASYDDDDDVPPPPPPPEAPSYAAPAAPAIRYRAVYAFPGTNPGELPIQEGEMLTQIENDGSGWVLVAKADGTRGYAPESYIARA